ncbi:hypothetical protein AB0939_19920 [Streptomyces sp. NPDC006990]|uniref:hypothetical protein n=1 Tax=unclassified Streptomyces TaxID=2593676 RepID=UPI003452DB50
MSVGMTPGKPRGPVRAAVLFAVVLLGVLHVLGCAHGAQAPTGARADSFSATAGASPQGRTGAPALRSADEHRHGSAECSGVDEPGVVGQGSPVPGPQDEPAAATGAAVPVEVPATSRSDRPRAGPRGERLRAMLGVRRT